MNLTLTATARQARYLRDRWGDEQLQKGVAVWETPPIFSIQAWLQQQWTEQLQRGTELPHLLTPEQERIIWQQTIPQESLDDGSFLRQGELVEHAISANRIFHQWREDGHSLVKGSHLQELELFQQWQSRFVEQCQQRGLLERARLAEWVVKLLLSGDVATPGAVHTYGKSQWSRAEQQILQALDKLGSELISEEGVATRSAAVKMVFPGESEEEIAAAYWLRGYMQESPGHRLAVVVPGLHGRRHRIEKLFRTILAPATLLQTKSGKELPYRFNRGLPLQQDPRIYTALQLIRMVQRGLPMAEASALLRSPWLLQGAEMEARSIFDLQLRRWRNPDVYIATLVRLFDQEGGESDLQAPRFLGALQAAEELELNESRLTTTEWAERFSHLLSFFEWAENGEKSDLSLSAYDGWRDGLDRFSAVGDFTGLLSLAEALSVLNQVLSRMDIPPQGEGAGVDILTPEEARGVHYDALWVMGMEDRNWPSTAELSPFLPLEWQRRQVPAADRSNSLKIAEEMVAGFAVAADQVFFTLSESSEDGAEEGLRETPLIDDVPLVDYSSLGLKTTVEQWWLDSNGLVLEEINEGALSLGRGSRVRGGSSILANQSQCPFRAFVRHRLQAESMESEQLGLDPRERGTLTHGLLERCWERLGLSSDRLNQLSEQELTALVAAAAEETVEEFRLSRQDRMGDGFAANESARLAQLAMRFLELDRGRVTSFRVEEMERLHRVTLDGISISVKMDRVDRLDDGRRILIDYKSGKVSRSGWQGERPEEPQLPLYTTLLDDVAAVLFGQIQVGEVAYKGEQEEESLLEGADGKGWGGKRKVVVSEGWEQQISQWERVVTELAGEFREGVALVAPLKGKSSCQYCGLEPLCRVEYEVERDE